MSTRAKKNERLKTSTPRYVFAKLACERAFERPECQALRCYFCQEKLKEIWWFKKATKSMRHTIIRFHVSGSSPRDIAKQLKDQQMVAHFIPFFC
jgi:hypothetical protein